MEPNLKAIFPDFIGRAFWEKMVEKIWLDLVKLRKPLEPKNDGIFRLVSASNLADFQVLFPTIRASNLRAQGHKMALGASNGAEGAKPMRYFKRRHLFWARKKVQIQIWIFLLNFLCVLFLKGICSLISQRGQFSNFPWNRRHYGMTNLDHLSWKMEVTYICCISYTLCN